MSEELELSQQDNLIIRERNFLDEVRDTVTDYQLVVLEKLSQIEKLPQTKEELIKMLGIAKGTWYMWLQSGSFRDALYELARVKFAADSLWIAESLTEKARAGDVAAIRTFYDLMGKREKPANNAVRVNIKFK